MPCPFLIKCPIGIDIIKDALGSSSVVGGFHQMQQTFSPKDYTISKLKMRLICYMLLCFGLIALLWFIFTFYDLHEKPTDFFEDYFFIGGDNRNRRSIRQQQQKQCPLKRCPILRPKLSQEPYIELLLKEVPATVSNVISKEALKETPKKPSLENSPKKESKKAESVVSDVDSVLSVLRSVSDSDSDSDSEFNSDSEASIEDIVKVGIDDSEKDETPKEKES